MSAYLESIAGPDPYQPDDALFALTGGAGDDVLLLLHGLGATAEVWRPLISLLPEVWPGRWIAPDLPGHGRSPDATSYAIGAQAASVSRLLPAGANVRVLGHSLGGVIGVLLASGWFGVDVQCVAAFSIKVAWSAEEKALAARRATAAPRFFPSREQAQEFYLKVSGLAGLAEPDDVIAKNGVFKDTNGWRLVADPATASVGGVELGAVLAAARCPVMLAAGSRDPMVALAELHALHAPVFDLGPFGHNPHVQAAEVLLPMLRALAGKNGFSRSAATAVAAN